MNKYAARALLARIYLYHDDNRKAFDLADQLIKDADTSGSYALYPHEKYVAAWSVEAKFGSESFLRWPIVWMILQDGIHGDIY